MIDDRLSELFANMLPPFDHRIMSHDTKFSFLSTHCVCATTSLRNRKALLQEAAYYSKHYS